MTDERPTLANIPGLAETSRDFRRKLHEVATRTGWPADELAAVLWSESKLDPTNVNPDGGATGIAQIMPFVAKALGTSTLAIRLMNREDQLDLVERLLRGKPSWSVPGDTYVRNFIPAAVGKPDDFELARKDSSEPSIVPNVSKGRLFQSNRSLSRDGETITVGDVRQKILKILENAKSKPRLYADESDPIWVRAARSTAVRVGAVVTVGAGAAYALERVLTRIVP
jgi:hypothetical protein